MKSIVYAICLCSLILSFQSCITKPVRGNGTVGKNKVEISDYSKLYLSGNPTIIYEQKENEAPYLDVEIDENLYPLLNIENEDGVLDIWTNENIRPTKYNIYTNSKSLESFKGSGSVKIHFKDTLRTPNLKISLSGSGNVLGDYIDCGALSTSVSGSANIKLAGSASEIDSHISGSGKVDALGMPAKKVKCSVSGSGHFFVDVEEQLQVRISGSGNVRYKGNPNIDRSVSGSGKIIPIE